MAIKGSLAAVLREIESGLPDHMEHEAERASKIITRAVRARTPTGRRVDPLTGADIGPSGKLRRSIKPLTVSELRSVRARGGIIGREALKGGASGAVLGAAGAFDAGEGARGIADSAIQAGSAGLATGGYHGHRISRTVWRAGCASDLSYAGYVEFGTARHTIKGKPHLAFWDSGQLVVTKEVHHPGSEGHFMFLRGALAAEKEWASTAELRLRQFLLVRTREFA